MLLSPHSWLQLAALSRRWAIAGYPHALFGHLTMHLFHSPFSCCILGHFFSFSRLLCSLVLPSKNGSFLSSSTEILSAQLSFDHCITRETAWIILGDSSVFLSLYYINSSVRNTPDSSLPTMPIYAGNSLLAYINFIQQYVKNFTEVRTTWQLQLLLYHLDLLNCHVRKDNWA